MKKIMKKLLLFCIIILLSENISYAQVVSSENLNPDKSALPWIVSGYEEDTTLAVMTLQEKQLLLSQLTNNLSRKRVVPNSVPDGVALPSKVDNSIKKWSRPFFNQNGGSCGSAAMISRVAAYEINCFNKKDGSLPENIFPSHWTWLLTYGHSGKWEMLSTMGCPSSVDYGGETYSNTYGWGGITYDDEFGWMTGYDKWYRAMFKRISKTLTLVITGKEDLKILKYWIYNHWNDKSFPDGGIVGAGCAISGTKYSGSVGKVYLTAWGPQIDHAITYVGYDDNFEADLNNNGSIEADEIGALILGNSWGAGWKNKGRVYVPYKVFLSKNRYVKIAIVRKNYKPQRVMKVKMKYSQRNKIQLNIGVSSDMNATLPEKTIVCDHFNFAGKTTTHMLGRWGSNKVLHEEYMEFGYDLTDLTKGYREDQDLKYFLYIKTAQDANGIGSVASVSVIDYNLKNQIDGERGIEYSSNLSNIVIDTEDKYISVDVSGNILNVPNNINYIKNNNLFEVRWSAPIKSFLELIAYKVYVNSELVAIIDSNNISEGIKVSDNVSVTAVYKNKNDSVESGEAKVHIKVIQDYSESPGNMLVFDGVNDKLNLGHILSNNSEFTIEFWLNVKNTIDYNTHIGPGWGGFLFHSNANRSVSVGFSAGSGYRLDTDPNVIKLNIWQHHAIVFDNGLMTLYIDGQVNKSITLDQKVAPSIGDFIVGRDYDGTLNAMLDEMRFWSVARTKEQINSWKDSELFYLSQFKNLIAYYKFNNFKNNTTFDSKRLAFNAVMTNFESSSIKPSDAFVQDNTGKNVQVEFNVSSLNRNVGEGIKFENISKGKINTWEWYVNDKAQNFTNVWSPIFSFNESGNYKVELRVNGDKTLFKTVTLSVANIVKPNISLFSSKKIINANGKVSFYSNSNNYLTYKWEFEGASPTSSNMPCVTVKYLNEGTYNVKLVVTNKMGCDTILKKNYVIVSNPKWKANFSINSTYVVKGEEVVFRDQSEPNPSKWEWKFLGATKEVRVERNPVVIYKNPGCYSVSLKSSNSIAEGTVSKEDCIYVLNRDPKNCLMYNNNKAYLNIASVFKSKKDAFTFEFWVLPIKIENKSLSIGTSTNEFLFYLEDDNTAVVYLNNKKHTFASQKAIRINKWQHIAIVMKKNVLTMYRNGVSIGEFKYTNGTVNVLNNFRIGSKDYSFNSAIDEFRVWGRALSKAELHNNIARELASPESKKDLEIYYDFNNSDGNVIDVQGNSDGILKSFGPLGDARVQSCAFCMKNTVTKIPVQTPIIGNLGDKKANDFNVYSVANKVFIDSKCIDYKVQVFSIIGSKVYSKEHNTGLINFNLGNGVYVIKIITKQGEVLIVKFLVKY